MAKPDLENKRVFLIASSNPDRAPYLMNIIQKHISNSTVFSAIDASEALFKIDNYPPHLIFIDVDLAKLNGLELTTQILTLHKEASIGVILFSNIPDNEHFIEEVLTGQVQFLTDLSDEQKVIQCINRSLNRIPLNEKSSYRIRFLAPEEILFTEGESGESVYFIKKGELTAIKNSNLNPIILGNASVGEFIGEMAHLNAEPRSATVKAITDCELIEIPYKALDTILLSKPAWSKALISTLSKRLKISNLNLTEKN